MDENVKYRIAFSRIKGINRAIAERILERVNSEEIFFTLPARDLAARLPELPSALAADNYRRSLLDTALTEIDFITRSRVRAIYFTDDTYPARLAECEDAPLLLYALGDTDLNASRIISIVGTRRATPTASRSWNLWSATLP